MPTLSGTHRLQTIGRRHEQPDDERKTAAQRGYGYRWQKAREAYLRVHSLCAYCERSGQLTQATVVDHIVPHRGDKRLFWDSSNWQPLCKKCHDQVKAKEEHRAGDR